jgi:glycosyltransferase involved in cell wall biosynthesis
MLKLIEINFYAHNECNTPDELLSLYVPTSGFIQFIRNRVEIQRIHHIKNCCNITVNDVKHLFFKSKNTWWYIPWKTIFYTKREQPDIVLIHGIVFQIQLIALRLFLGDKCKIICQHHGEQPSFRFRKYAQWVADRFTAGYFFTAIELADKWIATGQIAGREKCFEVLEASVGISRIDKTLAKSKVGMTGDLNFLWVGRLIASKDPFTVLSGFQMYVQSNPAAFLSMIFQNDDLLVEIKKVIEANKMLQQRVNLIGFVPSNELVYWYSASDYFISGSHREGSGYALLEAMACGCIPVVTDIPSFKKITDKGKFGILFEVGNKDSLLQSMMSLQNIDTKSYSERIIHHFKTHLSFSKIADDIYSACLKLKSQ